MRFFDAIESVFSYQLSIGQHNTIVLSPASTFHCELAKTAQAKSGNYLTTMYKKMGTDNEWELIAHFINSVKLHLDPVILGFRE